MASGKSAGDSATPSLLDRWAERHISLDDLVWDKQGSIQPEQQELSDPEQLGMLPCLVGNGDDSLPHLSFKDDVIGSGAMGVIHAAHQVPMLRDVAVKSLKEQASDEVSQRVLQEARVAGALEHPGVVPVYMLGTDEAGKPVIVMKRITGQIWSDLLEKETSGAESSDRRDPWVAQLAVLAQVCNAVHYAHTKGILHRDLKPDNVMVGAFGEVYVLDWGMAVSLKEGNPLGLQHVSQISTIAGTPGYMPPEAAMVAPHAIGATSDVYQLGAILHQIITGRPRHRGKSAMEVLTSSFLSRPVAYPDSVPQELAAICNKACHKEREQRFENAEHLRLAIEKFLQHRSSWHLADEARDKLAELKKLVAGSDPDDEEAGAVIHRLYGGCRFGFDEALQDWPENHSASEGRQELVATMARYEIDCGNAGSASRLLSELPEPAPELEVALDRLKERRQHEKDELEELRRLEDRKVVTGRRALIMSLTGVIWGGLYFALGVLQRAGLLTAVHEVMVGVNAVFGVFVLAATLTGRNTLWGRRVNRRFLLTLWTGFLVGQLLWLAAWHWRLPYAQGLTFTMLGYATVVWMGALAVDIKLIYAALPYLVGFVATALLPDLAWEIVGAATFGAMMGAALLWRLPDRTSTEAPKS